MNASTEATGTPILSVVIPLCNEEGNVALLLERLHDALEPLEVPYEVILVDDGSRDATWSIVSEAADKDDRLKGLSLSRNFGHESAMFAGLYHSSGEAVVTMDGDLQHPPSLVPELFKAWQEGNKVVETQRLENEDASIIRRTTSRGFYRLFSFLSGLPMVQGTSDFHLVDRQVVDNILQMKDAELFLRGITHWVGFRKTTIPYRAVSRHTGETKYNLLTMIRLAASSLFSFSMVPLQLGIWMGLITSGLAFLELIYILVTYFRGNAIPGWASTLTVISFMFGILFILIGIIGAYLGRVLETLKNRPRFIVQDQLGFRDLP